MVPPEVSYEVDPVSQPNRASLRGGAVLCPPKITTQNLRV